MTNLFNFKTQYYAYVIQYYNSRKCGYDKSALSQQVRQTTELLVAVICFLLKGDNMPGNPSRF